MSRRKYKSTMPKSFLWIDRELFSSLAWTSLSFSARCIYMCLKNAQTGTNDKELVVSYSCFQKNGIKSNSTISKGIKELKDRGLIDVKRSGGLFQKPNIYALTERWKGYGRPLPALKLHRKK